MDCKRACENKTERGALENIFNIFIESWRASAPTNKLLRKQDIGCEAADNKKNKHLLPHRPAAADEMSSKAGAVQRLQTQKATWQVGMKRLDAINFVDFALSEGRARSWGGGVGWGEGGVGGEGRS